jgi:hypothetical protein
LATFGSFWRLLDIFGDFWIFLEIFGEICGFLRSFEKLQILVILNSYDV